MMILKHEIFICLRVSEQFFSLEKIIYSLNNINNEYLSIVYYLTFVVFVHFKMKLRA